METTGKRLLGYNRQQVDEHLARVRKNQEMEARLIMENIEACRQERETLKGELESLQEEREWRLKSHDLLKYALERVNISVDLINQGSIEDIKVIKGEMTQKVDVHEKHLADVEKEIRQAKSRMDAMLQSILQISGEGGPAASAEEESGVKKVVGTIFSPHSKSEIVSAMGEDILGKTVVSSSGAQVGKVGNLLVDQATREVKGFYLKGGMFISSDCVMAVKKDSLMVSADWQISGQQADKAFQERLKSIKNMVEKQIRQDNHTLPGAIDTVPQAIDGGREEGQGLIGDPGKATQDSGGFWGDEVEGETWPGTIIAGSTAPEGRAQLPEVPVQAMEDKQEGLSGGGGAAQEAEAAVNIQQSDPAARGNVQDQGGPEEAPPSGKHPGPSPEERRGSPVVAREIKTVRYKYVVGKLAGEDLHDGEGQLIIRKDEVITPGVIDRAEREGKLAELIINMVIPGMET